MAEEESLKQKTKKGLYWSFFNQASTQIMQFAVGIVMARLLTPEDYGITALPAIFMAIAGIFIDGSFGSALIRKDNVTEQDLSTCFYYSFGMGVFMYSVLFLLAPFIADFYNTPILSNLIRVTALNFLWGPLGTPQGVILSRRLDFKTPARISIINKIVSAILGISAAYAGFGLWALVISGLSSSILGLIQTWIVVRWLPKAEFSKESFKYLWNYGSKMIASSLIDIAYNNVAPIFIGKSMGAKELGLYNRADGYARLPVNQITGILTSVTFPVLSRMQDDDEVLSRNYRRMIRVSAFVCFPIMIMLATLARPLILTMIGAKWESCIILLKIVCFERMWWPVHTLNRNLLQVKGRADLYLRVEMIKKPLVLIVILISLPMGLEMFCYSQLLTGIISLIINTHYTGKLLDLGIIKQLKDVFPIFFLSITMGIIVSIINSFIPSLPLQIVLGGAIGLLLYIGLAYLFRFDEINDVLYMLKIKRS